METSTNPQGHNCMEQEKEEEMGFPEYLLQPSKMMDAIIEATIKTRVFYEVSSLYQDLVANIEECVCKLNPLQLLKMIKKKFMKSLRSIEKLCKNNTEILNQEINNTLNFDVKVKNIHQQNLQKMRCSRYFYKVLQDLSDINKKIKQIYNCWSGKKISPHSVSEKVKLPEENLPITNERPTSNSNVNKDHPREESPTLMDLIPQEQNLLKLPEQIEITDKLDNIDSVENKESEDLNRILFAGLDPSIPNILEDQTIGKHFLEPESTSSANSQVGVCNSVNVEKYGDLDDFLFPELDLDFSNTINIEDQDNIKHILEPESTLNTNSQDGILNSIFTKKHSQVLVSENAAAASQSYVSKSITTCPLCQTKDSSTHSFKVCDKCQTVTSGLAALKDHVENVHKSSCYDCGLLVENINYSIHEASQKQKPLKVKLLFICNLCDKEFRNHKMLQRHEKIHKTLAYECDLCGKCTETKYEERKHKVVEHLSEKFKRNVCKVCYMHLESQEKLSKHLKLVHFMSENKLPDKITCIICNSEYEEPSELIKHMKIVHAHMVTECARGNTSGKPTEQCNICDYYFKTPKLRAIHIIVFHKTAPYKCVCKAEFFAKGILDFHILNHTRAEKVHLKTYK